MDLSGVDFRHFGAAQAMTRERSHLLYFAVIFEDFDVDLIFARCDIEWLYIFFFKRTVLALPGTSRIYSTNVSLYFVGGCP